MGMDTEAMDTDTRIRKGGSRTMTDGIERTQRIGREEAEDEIDLGVLLGDFFRIFGKLWWLVLLLALLGAGLFFLYTRVGYQPMYASEATFTVATASDESLSYSFYYSQNTADQLSKTFPYILESSYFQSLLLEELGTDTLNGTLFAQTLETSNMVTMRAESRRAEDAQEILTAALQVYPSAAYYVLGDIKFHLLNDPQPPTQPYNRPVLSKTLVMGAAGGGMVGMLILGILAFLKRTAKTPEDMKKITSLKCLAVLPRVKLKVRKKNSQRRISVLNPQTPYDFRESVRALQLRIDVAMRKRHGKVLLITSTLPGEGKSLLSINLAEILAQKGKRVLLIDADLRKQEDASLLECEDGMGLQDLFGEGASGKIHIRGIEKGKFWFFGSSRPVRDPAGVLSHMGIKKFLNEMKTRMDYIILDTPPCGIFQDASILAEYADGICYVVKYDYVPQNKVREGLSFLEERKANFLGYVFNEYPQSIKSYGYGKYGAYGYGYGYGAKKRSPQNDKEKSKP